MRQVIGLKDIWELENLVEQVVVDMRAMGYLYTSDGDSISLELSVEDRCRMLDEHIASLSADVFNFVSNPTLTQITFKEAVEMEVEDIYQLYLSPEILQKVRGILRKDPRLCYSQIVADEVTDEMLNQYIAVRWKENLKIWTLQREASQSLLSAKGSELTENRKEWLSELARVAESDIAYGNTVYPKLVCSERDGIVERDYYFWHHEIGNIQTLTYQYLPQNKLIYRYSQNHDVKSCRSIDEVLEVVATNPDSFSLVGYESDYSKKEIAFINKYLTNMRNAVKILQIERTECYAVLELDYSKFLGHTQVGEVVLIEKQGDTSIVACGWDDYVTKLQFTNEGFTVLETNLESAQLYYTRAVIKDLHRSLWKKISE